MGGRFYPTAARTGLDRGVHCRSRVSMGGGTPGAFGRDYCGVHPGKVDVIFAVASSRFGLHQQAGHMTASDLCAARQIISCQAGAIHT
jgi:hypothetical protein